MANTTTQNITSLTYKINGINNSQDKISDAMTALYLGIRGVYTSTGQIQTALSNGTITNDTYVAYDYVPGLTARVVVDTARNILERYA